MQGYKLGMFRKATSPNVSASFQVLHFEASLTIEPPIRFECSWNAIRTKHVHLWGLSPRNGENPMKMLISTFAVALALAFTGPAFAGATAAKTEADCAKAGGTWNATTKMCEEKKM